MRKIIETLLVIIGFLLCWILFFYLSKIFDDEFAFAISIITWFILREFIINLLDDKKEGNQSEWRRLRNTILCRDNHRCSECKKYYWNNKSKLHVHHIVERAQWWEDIPDNLILLCVTCHKVHHKNNSNPIINHNIKRSIIESAIKNQQILNIDYRSESIGWIWKNSTRKVKPDKFYSENWHYYMSWHCFLTNEYRYFRVSRIIKFHK